jgi:cobalt-zinc-cadmium efflux system outer membrane protein
LQASLLPNPELEGEVENFGGTGEFRGTDVIETTIVLSQLVELGGERSKRMQLTRLDSRLAGWDYETKRLAVLTRVAQRFAELVAAQEKMKLAAENARLAAEAAQTVHKLSSAGKISPTEGLKADVEVATSEIEKRNAARALAAARQKMVAVWGDREARFSQAVGSMSSLDKLPSLESLAALLDQNPGLARWQTEIAQRKAALSLAKAQAVPDVTVGVGFRKFYETENNDHAFLVTASIPLPIFDRNQGGIAKARFAVTKAHIDHKAAETALRTELSEAYAELATAHDELQSLRGKVLPMATKAFAAIQRSFGEGKSSYLDLLDAQRTLVEARGKQVEALATYHIARATVEAVIGQSIERATPKNSVTTTAESERSPSND